MRIISGKFQRRIIKPPSNLPVRPTTDIAKEALFNILNNHFDFDGLRVLDLFAGTGSISYEFASRGAGRVVSVDSNPRCTAFIGSTIQSLELSQNMMVVRADVFKFLATCRSEFDIVFADPPFDLSDIETLPNLVLERKILVSGGWLVLEHPSRLHFDSNTRLIDKRNYGKVNFSIFEQP